MTATPKLRRRTSILGAVLVAALSATFSVAPAQAVSDVASAKPAVVKVTYAALGDSYAAGVGGGDYLDLCLTSPNGYAALLAGDPGGVHADLRGCTGATTDTVMATQLAGLDQRTKTVTLTVGANDLGVGALGQYCLTHTSEECLAALQFALGALETIATDLDETLAAIRDVAPKATVYVTGYPLLFEPSTDPRFIAVNQGVQLLNDLIEASVAAAGSGFVYVDIEQVFAGHGIGAADPWILAPPDVEAFHPNPAGYAAYAEAIRAAG
ncbi:SGNH/GDSL hydrolase family protein [Agromyces bauzanensis]